MRRILPLLLLTVCLASCSRSDPDEGPPPFLGEGGSWTPGEPVDIEMRASGIVINGNHVLLRGGSLQWFRIPEEAWADRLLRFREAGFNTVDIYIPWNVVEPEEGRFEFESLGLRRFLELCGEYELFVAVRPGPFITNEMDGGGLPAWLTRKSSKEGYLADGKVNIRTHDPDFIEPVARYFTELNKVLDPYLATRGGPVLLYVIENEYNWFATFFGIDKLFTLDGRAERPKNQEFQPALYMAALRDMVLADGIDIPIVTCPGDARASATGDVADVVPFPNVYEWATPKQPEQAAHDLLVDMHDPSKHGGAYVDLPTDSMEVDRSPQQFRRLIMGGMDALYGFNMVGMVQPGYLNGITLAARAQDEPPHWGPPGQPHAPWLPTIFEFSADSVATGFIAPLLGYFHNVLDYRGVIGPSGMPRELYYQFRRDNMFFDSVERWLGRAGTPNREGLKVANEELGTREEPHARVHYWLDAGNGVAFLNLLNQSGTEQWVAPHGIAFGGTTLPRYSSMHVPVALEPNGAYAKILVTNLPVTETAILDYSTSELLTVRDFNDERLLIVYGDEDSTGELSLSGLAQDVGVTIIDDAFAVRETGEGRVVMTVEHGAAISQALVNLPDGSRLRVVATTRKLAGRWWFDSFEGSDVAIVGVDRARIEAGEILVVEAQDETVDFTVLSSAGLKLQAFAPEQAFDTLSSTSRYRLHGATSLPQLPDLLAAGASKADRDEVLVDFPDDDWQGWSGEPRSLEDLGIFRGHAWYRAEFELEQLLALHNRGRLFIEHASDFLGIYVNGHYVATMAPLGTEIDSHSSNGDYVFESLKPHLRVGRNVLAFRTEVWGHGSFMFPKGKLIATQFQLPSVGYEGQKGLFGEATIGGIPLEQWKVQAGLHGQERGFQLESFDDSGWSESAIPLGLDKGDVRWYRTEFRSSELGLPGDTLAPLVLELEGERSKATIYVNGRMIGRWLSDEAWLQRGTFARPMRDMWIANDADHFPLPREILHEGDQPNVIAIVFEDASHSSEAAGRVDTLRLRYDQEDLRWRGGAFEKGGSARVEHRFTISP